MGRDALQGTSTIVEMMGKHPVHAAGNAIAWNLMKMGGVKAIYLIRWLVLAMLLPPADFGVAAIAMTAVDLLLSVTNFGLIPGLVQAESMDDNKYDAAWTFDVARSSIVALLTIVFAPMIANAFAVPLAVPIIQALAIRPFIESLTSIKVASFNRDLAFRPLAYLKIVEVTSNTVISVSLALFIGVWAIVIGSLGGVVCMVIVSYMVAPYRPRISFRWKAVRSLMNFGGWVFLTSLVVMAGGYGVRLTISRQLGVEELGIYFLAMRLAFLPSEVANEAAGTVAFPLFARLQSNVTEATRAFRALLSGLAAVIYPVCALIIVLAPSLTRDLLGPSWAGTEAVIQVLSLVVMFGVLGDVAVPVFKGFGQPYRITLLEMIQSSLIISFVSVLTRRYGLAGAATAWLPAVLCSQLLSLRFLQNILDHPLQGLQKPLIAILSATGLCCLVALTADFLIPGVVGLFTAGALGLGSALLLLRVADRSYDLGFARNLAVAFPKLASLIGLVPVEPE